MIPQSRTLVCNVAASLALSSALIAVPAIAREVIPFAPVDGGLAQVQASIDGAPPEPMLVDMGAGLDVISSREATKLRIAVTGSYTGWRLSGARVDTATGTVTSLSVGSLIVHNAVVGVWSGLDAAPIAGLISATAFREQPVTFDFAHDELILEDPHSLEERARSEPRVPLLLADDRDISLGIFANFNFASKTGLCEVDTGSQGIFIDRRYAAELGINLGAVPAKTIGSSGVIGQVVPIASVALAGDPSAAIADPRVIFGNLIYDCSVGNEFWRNRSVTFDIPDRALYVSGPVTVTNE
jgi:Aspartyl protease